MGFGFKQVCVLTSAKGGGGKEQNSDPKAIFTLSVKNLLAAQVAALFGREDDEAELVVDSFFAKPGSSGSRDKLYHSIASLSLTYFSQAHHMIYFNDRRGERVAWLGAIEISPLMDGKFDLSLRGTIDNPGPGLGEYLMRHVMKDVRVHLECDPEFKWAFKGEEKEAPKDEKQRDLLDEQNAGADAARATAVGDAIKADERTKKKTAAKKAAPKPAAKKAKPARSKKRTGRN